MFDLKNNDPIKDNDSFAIKIGNVIKETMCKLYNNKYHDLDIMFIPELLDYSLHNIAREILDLQKDIPATTPNEDSSDLNYILRNNEFLKDDHIKKRVLIIFATGIGHSFEEERRGYHYSNNYPLSEKKDKIIFFSNYKFSFASFNRTEINEFYYSMLNTLDKFPHNKLLLLCNAKSHSEKFNKKIYQFISFDIQINQITKLENFQESINPETTS